MVTIKEVKTKKEIKEFVNFPLNLYKGSPYFVPELYGEEIALFKDSNIYNETCDQVFYLAYNENKEVVGRIQGIIQRQYNEIHNEKRVRFSRFDSIDDTTVSSALFSAVENWAKEKGMDKFCGPLGYSDLEREGMLIEGFDEMSTFEEQYNYDYYQKLTEDYGFTKEVDWVESRLTYNPDYYEKIERLTDIVMKRYNLHVVDKERHESKSHFVDRVAPGFFELLDSAYAKLYGVVPFTDKMKKSIVADFKLILDPKYILIINDENEKTVAFGLCFPALGDALLHTGGKLTIRTLLKILNAVKHPKAADLGLIACDFNYLNKGIIAPIVKKVLDLLKDGEVKYVETNLNLEDNTKIRQVWKYFNERQHKRRRSFVKDI